MNRKKIVIYGAGLLGQQVLHHTRTYYDDVAEILGFLDDTKTVGHQVLDGKCVLGSVASAVDTSSLQPGTVEMVFAIGYSNMQHRRTALENVLRLGYRLFDVIHPHAIIEPSAEFGAGSIVLAGAILDQNVKLGAACFVDIGVRLGDGTTAGVNNYISSGTSTGSRVSIGDNCFIGMDCTITDGVQLGSNLFINAKTLVPRNVGNDVKLVELHKSKMLPHPKC